MCMTEAPNDGVDAGFAVSIFTEFLEDNTDDGLPLSGREIVECALGHPSVLLCLAAGH